MKKFTGAILIVLIVFAVSLGGHTLFSRGQSPFLRGTVPGSTGFTVNSIYPTSAQSAILLGQKIDVNSATKGDLEALPGIGPSLAERIVKYRDVHGRFKTIDDLDDVSGIGPKTVERLKEFLLLYSPKLP